MRGQPKPGAIVRWRGSHDVVGTRRPLILVETTADPRFWIVAPLDADGAPGPNTFAVPVADLARWRRPWPPGGPSKEALRRVAAGLAAAISFALGAWSLSGPHPVFPLAQGLLPALTVQAPAWDPPDGASPRFDGGASAPSRAVSTLVSERSSADGGVEATAGAPRAGRSEPAGGGIGGGGTGGGGTGGTGTGGGGTGGGGTGGGGTGGGGTGGTGGGGGGDPVSAGPGKSDSAPGHNTPPGKSDSAPGHDSSPGKSDSAPGRK